MRPDRREIPIDPSWPSPCNDGMLLPLLLAVSVSAGEVVPVDGMLITEDTTFVPGTYALPTGVKIGAAGITLDMNGATLDGVDFGGFGVNLNGFDDVTIRNGTLRGYFYGAIVRNCARPTVTACDLSDNWVDPEALGDDAPFLDINAPADLDDRVNLGGGLLMVNVTEATVTANAAERAANGIDAYETSLSLIADNACSDNKGWGIHLNASTDNVIARNVADHCTRAGLGDSAGVLLVNGSHRNEIIDNQFRHSGDGFFIGNEHGCPSNDNLVQGNDGSFAGANAFEATFSSGNRFIANRADGARYGFWLGYSHTDNAIVDNSIRANEVAGIEIEHGQGNEIRGNTIVGNGGAGIVLRTDGVAHFPAQGVPVSRPARTGVLARLRDP